MPLPLLAAGKSATQRLRVIRRGSSVDVELVCGGRALLSGPWEGEVRRDGAVVPAISPWRTTCRFRDSDGDYMELEARLAGGLRLQRHFLLARKDHFLFVADAVLGERPGELAYCGSLPLAAGVSFRAAAASREGYLVAGGRCASVLPLALPEWRSDTRVGELAAADGRLQLRQAIAGRSLLAPLFVDLQPDRLRRRLTWRQLTVAESLAAQPADVAVGYRVAIGRQQWLIYRSLAAKANRSVLGHNLSTETLIARFVKGEVESIIEIE